MKRILSFLVAFLGLLGVSSPAIADETTIANGYYYVVAMKDGTEEAIYSNNTKLAWEPIEMGNPAFIFKIEKAAETDQYYMQSLLDGKWFGTIGTWYATECNLSEADRKPVVFEPTGDGATFKWRPAEMRWDYTDPAAYKEHGNFGFDVNRDTNGDGTPDYYHSLAQWDGANWTLKAVSEADLNKARMSIDLRKAFELFNSSQLYTVSTDPLITNVDNTADPATGDPSQFFAICQRLDDPNSSFANLIDGKADDNYFQSTWTTETNISKDDQWLQVDVSADGTEKQVAGFHLKFGLRASAWGSAQQPTDITLYATNDGTIAKDADISSIQTVANTEGWVKIGDFNLPYDKALKYVSGNGGMWLATVNGDETMNRWLTKDIILMGNKYRYLRFYMNQMAVNNSDNHQFTFSQFQLYEIKDPAVAEVQREKVETLKNLIESGKAKVKAGTVSAEDLAAIEAAMEAVKNSKSKALINLENLIDSINKANISLYPGEAPGMNDPAKVEAYNAAFKAANGAIHTAHTDAEYDQFRIDLLATLKAAQTTLNPITNGYYNIVNRFGGFYEHKAMEARPGENIMGWNSYEAKSVAQLFKITDLGNKTYSIQNVQTGQFFGTVEGQSKNPVMTETQEVGQIFTAIPKVMCQYNIANTANGMAYHSQYHGNGENKRGLICTWDGGAGSCSAWTLVKLTDQHLIDSLVAAAPLAQAKALADVEFKAVEAAKNLAKGYKKGNPLITNADDTDPDANQFFTTCQEQGASDYSAYSHLIDGDWNTCFQSTWDPSQAEKPQWLQMDLKDHPVKDFNFYWGLRDGFWGAREFPTSLTFYATNNETVAKNEEIKTLNDLIATGEWTKICDIETDQNVPMTEYDGTKRGVGIDINGKMDQPYRFIRFFVNDTYREHANQDYTIGELQIYENTIDDANSPVKYVEGLQAAVDAMDAQAATVKAAKEAGTLGGSRPSDRVAQGCRGFGA